MRLGRSNLDWMKEYGTAYKLRGCFGTTSLVITDPRAIHRILHESLQDYPEAGDVKRFFEMMFGRGVIWAHGEDHKRHRRVLSPAFSIAHMRKFVPLFQEYVAQLAEKWNDELRGSSHTIDVIPWLHKITLGIIGESRQIPTFISSLKAKYLPSAIEKITKRYLELSNATAKEVMREAELTEGRDVLSVLVRANSAEDPRKRLTEAEILAQMSTLIQAGHHTTGYTLSWILYELAAHPDDQVKVYEEISRVRKGRGELELTSEDYDSLNHLTLALKETLRLHPVFPNLLREASKNDVLPLDFPIVSEDGKTLKEIPITKGQRIWVDVPSYNRLESVWGPNPDEWNPGRHERLDFEEKKQAQVGLFANVLTFSGGPKGCIG
ncbi:hypothetical protein V5O48_005085 [Marasmius crinis-equi]|uniref:Cytochrome P450 n=1 Tax=Marasmius crinis-equi TaxID=585013 RepID=A0ABR3FNC7_9AGAR